MLDTIDRSHAPSLRPLLYLYEKDRKHALERFSSVAMVHQQRVIFKVEEFRQLVLMATRNPGMWQDHP
jgi:hypothetical protein